MESLNFVLEMIFNAALPFALGGVVVGAIVNAVNNRTINDLKILLQGFGVLREQRQRWTWSKRWGISFGRK